MLLPIRLALLPIRLALRIARLLGLRRLAWLGAGVAVGLLVAPTTGAEARVRLRRLIDERRPAGDQDLAEKVRFELSHSPRTWHLPQPVVEVVGNVAVLRGQVPHGTGKEDLGRTAASVSGIVEVDNRLIVAGPGTA
jgi:osmotically-inducible protein OsmY